MHNVRAYALRSHQNNAKFSGHYVRPRTHNLHSIRTKNTLPGSMLGLVNYAICTMNVKSAKKGLQFRLSKCKYNGDRENRGNFFE